MDRLIEVHPIERLRFVASGGWAGPSMLAAEAAWALADLACSEAPALVPACRRLLDRQPWCGPLWWVAARVLEAGDPVAEAHRCAQALEEDDTPQKVQHELPRGARVVRRGGVGELASADLVLVEADALGPSGMLVDASSERLLMSAIAVEVPIWVEAGVGRVMPPRIWEAMSSRIGEQSTRSERSVEDRRATYEVQHPGVEFGFSGSRITLARRSREASRHGGCTRVDLRGVERVVGPRGARPVDIAIRESDCPEPPELLDDFPTTAGGRSV